VNLSDLAGKGAIPVGYLLTTALPRERDEAWLERFAEGLARDQREFGIGLLGGDSVATTGPVTLSVAAVGRVRSGEAVLRSGAKPGDTVFVSGTLGDGALGLRALRGELPELSAAHRDFLADRYRLPRPRLQLGRRLVGKVHAMMDISDGLVADLGHICETSSVGAVVEATRLPLSPAVRAAIATDASRGMAALAGGDDYELLFTASADAADGITMIAREIAVPITAIGRIERGKGVRVIDGKGAPVAVADAGYRHF
jgi:thiamine-monophosphate kinase